MITALITVIQLITGIDFSVNIYSAVIYAQRYCFLLPKNELHGRFIHHLCISWLLSLINSTINNSLLFRANKKKKKIREEKVCIVSFCIFPPIPAPIPGVLIAVSLRSITGVPSVPDLHLRAHHRRELQSRENANSRMLSQRGGFAGHNF